MMITYRLIERLEELASKPDGIVRVINKVPHSLQVIC